jgi:hypothetical protein
VSHDDFAVETVPGLPAALPAGESLLWQGKPQWRSLAIRALHARKVAIYFLILMVWSGSEALMLDQGWSAALFAAGGQLALGILAAALLTGIAWLVARTTIYSITTERIAIRFGVALQFTINLPFTSVEVAQMALHSDGTGDIPLGLSRRQQVSFLLLWPHVRPWHFWKVQPMLRAISEPAKVAALLGDALTSHRRRAPAIETALTSGTSATTPPVSGTSSEGNLQRVRETALA